MMATNFVRLCNFLSNADPKGACVRIWHFANMFDSEFGLFPPLGMEYKDII